MTTNRQEEQNPLERQGRTELEEAVAASDLEAAPASQMDPQGSSFYNPALVGSGTIMSDGTYGAPLPDPNLEARKELTTEAEEQDGTTGPRVTKTDGSGTTDTDTAAGAKADAAPAARTSKRAQQ